MPTLSSTISEGFFQRESKLVLSNAYVGRALHESRKILQQPLHVFFGVLSKNDIVIALYDMRYYRILIAYVHAHTALMR